MHTSRGDPTFPPITDNDVPPDRTAGYWSFAPHARNTALFALVVLVMGSGYVAIRIGVETIPPLFLGALRFYLAAFVLLGVAAATGMAWLPRSRRDWTAIVVLGLLVFAGAIGFLFVGQQRTPAGTAAVVMCLGPVLTALIAHVFLPSERFSPRQTTGIGLGLLGAIVITIPGGTIPGDGAGVGVGAILVFCAAASGSLGSVLLGRIRTAIPLTVQAGWGALVGGVVLHGASIGLGEPSGTVTWTPTQVGILVYLSVAVSGLGYVALLRLLRTVGPTRTSFTSYGSPVVTIVLGSVLLYEPISAVTIGGFATIVAGFVLLNGGRGPPPANDALSQSESTGPSPVRDAEHVRATIEGAGRPVWRDVFVAVSHGWSKPTPGRIRERRHPDERRSARRGPGGSGSADRQLFWPTASEAI